VEFRFLSAPDVVDPLQQGKVSRPGKTTISRGKLNKFQKQAPERRNENRAIIQYYDLILIVQLV
jgi:hypothetical protein